MRLRLLSLIILICILPLSASSQLLKGRIVDAETQMPISNVAVEDVMTGTSTTTAATGIFFISTHSGNKLLFTQKGYRSIERIAPSYDTIQIEMVTLSVRLPVFTLHEQSKFQKDSTDMAEQFVKDLNRKPTQAKFNFENGIAVNGLITIAAERLSKSYKERRRFQLTYQKDLEQKFIDTRYRPELVTQLTGLKNDSLLSFMNSWPMDYQFARAASDLEIKAWIRQAYRDYNHGVFKKP